MGNCHWSPPNLIFGTSDYVNVQPETEWNYYQKKKIQLLPPHTLVSYYVCSTYTECVTWHIWHTQRPCINCNRFVFTTRVCDASRMGQQMKEQKLSEIKCCVTVCLYENFRSSFFLFNGVYDVFWCGVYWRRAFWIPWGKC